MDLLERLTVLISSDVSDVFTYKRGALITIDTIFSFQATCQRS